MTARGALLRIKPSGGGGKSSPSTRGVAIAAGGALVYTNKTETSKQIVKALKGYKSGRANTNTLPENGVPLFFRGNVLIGSAPGAVSVIERTIGMKLASCSHCVWRHCPTNMACFANHPKTSKQHHKRKKKTRNYLHTVYDKHGAPLKGKFYINASKTRLLCLRR